MYTKGKELKGSSLLKHKRAKGTAKEKASHLKRKNAYSTLQRL
jgi:hypothetical protein